MSSPSRHAHTVLVADDLESMRKLIARNLEQIGCRTVLQAANGVEAFSARGVDGQRSNACWVQGDPLLSYSLFANLIKNAVEAAPVGGRLAITMESLATRFGQTCIRNSGTVPMTIRERFFEKFSTADKPGGSGIGTYSAALFAQAQGGSVTMQTSEADNETVLVVGLPLSGLEAP